MTGLNRRVVVTSIDDIAVETEPVPQPRPGEVRVRPTVAGICGSDTHACLGSHPFIDLPYRPGHEVVGSVITTAQNPRKEARWLRRQLGP